MSNEPVTKAVVSVSEMARMVGLSRARFYQLVRSGAFPTADEDPQTNRPFYGEEKQRQCLEVRRRNCGIDGKPVLFYARRRDSGTTTSKSPAKPKTPAKPKATTGEYIVLLDGLGALGVTATAAQVEPVVKELFPGGTDGTDPGEVIRAVFLRLRRQNSSGSAG